MFIGYFLRRLKVVDQSFISQATSLVFYVALPAKLFTSVAESNVAQSFHPLFAVYVTAMTLFFFFLFWAVAVKIPKREDRSAFVHACYRGNFVYVGLAMLQIMLNKSVIPSTAVVIAFVMPLYNILAVFILSYYGEGEKPKLSRIVLDMLKNPMIIAVLIGIPFSLFGWNLPMAAEKTVDYMGSMASPLALLFIGASIEFKALSKHRGIVSLSVLCKLVITPIIALPIAVLIGLSGEEIATAFILFAVPSAMNVYVMTEKMGGNGSLASEIIVGTMLGSVLTMPVGIFLLRIFRII